MQAQRAGSTDVYVCQSEGSRNIWRRAQSPLDSRPHEVVPLCPRSHAGPRCRHRLAGLSGPGRSRPCLGEGGAVHAEPARGRSCPGGASGGFLGAWTDHASGRCACASQCAASRPIRICQHAAALACAAQDRTCARSFSSASQDRGCCEARRHRAAAAPGSRTCAGLVEAEDCHTHASSRGSTFHACNGQARGIDRARACEASVGSHDAPG